MKSRYARLAGGANYALAKAKSVAQFVDTAAFGLAVKKRFRGEDGWTTDWHYQATMLWARVSGASTKGLALGRRAILFVLLLTFLRAYYRERSGPRP